MLFNPCHELSISKLLMVATGWTDGLNNQNDIISRETLSSLKGI